MKKVQVLYEKTDTGYSGFVEDYPVFSTGSTKKELEKNIKEALSLHDKESKFSLSFKDVSKDRRKK